MKKASIIFLILIISLLFFGQIGFAETDKQIRGNNGDDKERIAAWSSILLEKGGVGILPTSPFYFVKEWGRGIRKFFAFDPAKKAELELRYSDEKLLETAKVVDENCGESTSEIKAQKEKNQCTQEALEKALNNYLKAQEKLAKRLESLPQNKNIGELLNKLGERIILHQAIFDEIINGAPVLEKAVREGGRTVGAGQITEIIKRVGGFDGTEEEGGIARRNKAELIDAIAKGTKAIEKLPYPEGIKELKALEVLTRIEEQLPEEAKKGIETAKENIEKRLLEEGKIQAVIDNAGNNENWDFGGDYYVLSGITPFRKSALRLVIERLETRIKSIKDLDKTNIEALKDFKVKIEEAKPSFTIRKTGGKGGDYLPATASLKLEIDGIILGEFKEISGIESDVEVVEYQDGDDLARKRPGRTKYSNIVLKRGSVTDTKLHDWYERIVKGAKERKSISIIVLDRAGQEVGRYNLFDAFPVKFEGGDYSVEEIEFRAEGGVIIGKKITPDKVESGSEQIRVPAVCPLIAPDTSRGKEECLKAAKQLDEKYPGCNYAKICEEISEQKPSLDCGPSPAAPGNWKCIDGAWKDISQCGKIYCFRYDPVCGTDGKTYSCGEIDAKSCGVEVAYKGECKKQEYPTSSFPGQQPTTPSKSMPAKKLPQPIFCTQEWNPVCGTDNKTYSNECMAMAAGVGVQYKDECKKEVSPHEPSPTAPKSISP